MLREWETKTDEHFLPGDVSHWVDRFNEAQAAAQLALLARDDELMVAG